METITKETTPEAGKSEAQKVEQKEAPKAKESQSQRLFADWVGTKKPGASSIPSVETPKAEIVPEVKKEEAKTPPVESKPEPKYLKVEDFRDAKLKLKVDGVEEEATLEDVIRRVQLDKHITLKGQRLGDEEKKLKAKEQALEERERLLLEIASAQSKPKEVAETEESIVKDDPVVRRLETELKALREANEAILRDTRPLILKASLERASNYVKDTLKMDDFLSYQDKIKDYLGTLPKETAIAMDNEAGWVSVFKDLKLKELMEAASAKPKIEEKPVERPAPKVVPIESGRSVGSGIEDDRASKLNSLFKKAQRLTAENSPDRYRAWEEYLFEKDRPQQT